MCPLSSFKRNSCILLVLVRSANRLQVSKVGCDYTSAVEQLANLCKQASAVIVDSCESLPDVKHTTYIRHGKWQPYTDRLGRESTLCASRFATRQWQP